MNEEKPPSGFTWGLRPGGGEAPEPDRVDDGPEETSTAPVDIGHVSVVDQGELVVPDAAAGAFDDGEPTAPFDFRAPAPPPVDSVETPVFHPGRALPWEQPPAFDPALDGADGALGAEEAGLGLPAGESAPPSALDSLFAEDRFRLDESHEGSAVVPFVARPVVSRAPSPRRGARAVPPGAPMPRSQRVLMWVAGGLVTALALAGLFFVGTRVGDALPATEVAPTAPPPVDQPVEQPAEPVAPPTAVGPVAPGEHAWDDLLGTECIEPFESAWQESYTVVECTEPHGAQLVARGRFDESALDAFPGVAALQARMNPLCSTAENIDYTAASAYADIQVSASFAGTEEDWADGNRTWFCFVSRSSGEPLTENVAGPPRPPVEMTVVPAPEP
jgi:hypothetical protein